MKKIIKWTLGVLGGIILLVLILLFAVPVIFKDKIKTKVEQVINESVNAQVKFDGYKLTFFRNFPNLSFTLNDVSVTGVDKFQGDTLAGFKSFDLVFNLASLFKETGYEVKSVILDKPAINAIVLADGSANWDIVKDTAETEAEVEATDTSASSLKLQLRQVEIRDASISYNDAESKMAAVINNLNFSLSGDMFGSETDLLMALNIGELDFLMDDIKYLSNAIIDAKIGLIADLDNMKFTFGE
ncbi:MAG: AsmA family protein, partial [Bacteroidales bacterium]|nr:AsmA family protein [Bacteroidales bacterium]